MAVVLAPERKDYYAAISFDNVPGGKRYMIGWMSNWHYAAPALIAGSVDFSRNFAGVHRAPPAPRNGFQHYGLAPRYLKIAGAAILLTLLVANAAGCTSDSSPPAGVARSPAATSAAPISNQDQVCEAVMRWAARTSYDMTRTVVLDYLRVHDDPGHFSVREKLAIRRAYFAFQEKGYRSIAATATEPKLRAALHAFADGWAGFAKNPSVDSKLWEQPDRTALNKYCTWRVIGIPDPMGS